jgi:hypothetical protein
LWHAKARKLNIPLSAKGHPVGQRGASTGIAIDSFKDRFSMLPDKMASLVAAGQELVASEVSTPRLIARVRGKALHYGCAIPFIASLYRRRCCFLSSSPHHHHVASTTHHDDAAHASRYA